MRLSGIPGVLLVVGVILIATVSLMAQSSILTPPNGTVRGRVSDSEGGLKGVSLVIEGKGARYDVVTNEDGYYEETVKPGIYSIYLGPSEQEAGYREFRRAKFRVLPGATATIDLSSYAGFEYCASNGERVINLRATDGDAHETDNSVKPKYDQFPVIPVSGEPLDLVVEYCKKDRSKDSIVYTSAVITFDEITIYAEAVKLEPKTLQLKILGKRATLAEKGQHKVTPVLTASFGDGNPYIDLTKGFTYQVRGEGSIGEDRSFEFATVRNDYSRFTYKDREKGIIFVSKPSAPLFVTTETPNRITINGVGVLVKDKASTHETESYLNFKVTLQAQPTRLGAPYNFAIEIPALDGGYSRSGDVPKKNIEVIRHKDLDEYTLAESKRPRNNMNAARIEH